MAVHGAILSARLQNRFLPKKETKWSEDMKKFVPRSISEEKWQEVLRLADAGLKPSAIGRIK